MTWPPLNKASNEEKIDVKATFEKAEEEKESRDQLFIYILFYFIKLHVVNLIFGKMVW